MFVNRNVQDPSLNTFLASAALSLPPGTCVMFAKFRYRNDGSTTQTASCVW